MQFLKKILLTLMYVSLVSAIPGAQETTSDRIPVYPIPYEYPTVENIKAALNRVRVYYESSSPQIIVDVNTGKEITDFSTFNQNAEPSQGFSSEWS